VALIKTLPEKSPYFTNLACSLNVGIGFFHFFISGTQGSSTTLSLRPTSSLTHPTAVTGEP
jgi:hypothetical protein